MTVTGTVIPLADGTVYSRRKNHCPFSTPRLEDYTKVVGDETIERLERAAERLKGLKLLELNATAQGGGVAEMLYSSVPFLNSLGIETDWQIIKGDKAFFECTKGLHNLLQGMRGTFSSEAQLSYFLTIGECTRASIIDYQPDVVMVNDPQPLGLAHFLRKANETWLWRCHIDIEDQMFESNPSLWDFMTTLIQDYNAAIFSAVHYIISRWPLPSFVIPPFIDPLSEKNRELSELDIIRVLDKYGIDPTIPIIAQIGRFDPWKGLDRTIATFRLVRKERTCQLVMAGGMASDDPEGERILNRVYEDTKNDRDIHVLNLQMEDRLQNWFEVNALQRAASVIMQPSTREGFGLVITEALWKGKPVIASDIGGIPLQLRDGETGYFYDTPHKTANRVLSLLKNPRLATVMGARGKQYVKEHFLLPDRAADYLMTIEMVTDRSREKWIPHDCIISFHPWFKLSKRHNHSSG
jgi:trehalose synthase